MDIILDAGYSKPLVTISLDCKQELTSTLMLHHTLYRNKAVLDQLKSGLKVLYMVYIVTQQCLISSITGDGCSWCFDHVSRSIETIFCCWKSVTTYWRWASYLLYIWFILIFAEVIKNLFTKVHFSEAGNNQRTLEEATYMLFMDLLRDCEGKTDNCVCRVGLRHHTSLCRWRDTRCVIKPDTKFF